MINDLMKQWDLDISFGSVNEMRPKYQYKLARYWFADDENPETLLLYISRAWDEYTKEYASGADPIVTEASERTKARLYGFLDILKGF